MKRALTILLLSLIGFAAFPQSDALPDDLRQMVEKERYLRVMFYNCENLDKIKIALMSDPSDSGVYYYWAAYVKSSGTLYVPTGSTVNAMVPSGWSKSTY